MTVTGAYGAYPVTVHVTHSWSALSDWDVSPPGSAMLRAGTVGAWTKSVNDCVAAACPLLAVIVMGQYPEAATGGLPESSPLEVRVTPGGSAPDSLNVSGPLG